MDDSDIEIIEDVTIVVTPKKTSSEDIICDDPLPCTYTAATRPSLSDVSVEERINEFGEAVEEKKKGGRRNRDEAMQLRAQQLAEKAEKKRIRDETKLQKENEKKKRKIEREAISAHKSKAEQHTYCHVGKALLNEVGGLELAAKMMFMERNLENQLVIEDSLDMRIEWRRKEIDLIETEISVEKLEYTCQQHMFAVVVPGEILRQLVESNSLEDFVISQQTEYPIRNSQLVIVCYGDCKLSSSKIMDLSLMLFEECRTHLEFLKTPNELALFLAQTVRGLAKAASSGSGKLLVDIEKGIDDGSRDEIVVDWYAKMLKAVDRMSHAQRREIIRKYPDPLAAAHEFERRGYDDVMGELSNLVCENGRRLGPQMAHRLFVMLTDTTGKPVID